MNYKQLFIQGQGSGNGFGKQSSSGGGSCCSGLSGISFAKNNGRNSNKHSSYFIKKGEREVQRSLRKE